MFLSTILHTGAQQRVLLCIINSRIFTCWLQSLLLQAAAGELENGSAAFYRLQASDMSMAWEGQAFFSSWSGSALGCLRAGIP